MTQAQEMFQRDEASQGLGMELIEDAQGRARVRMPVTAAMVNGHGTAHGGYIFLLAESPGRSREIRP